MPSLRFQTTTQNDLESVASRRHEAEEQSIIAERLRARKIANEQTSILFGSHGTNYETEASQSQQAIAKSPVRNRREEQERQKALINEITKENLCLANFENGKKHETDYTSSSKLLYPTGAIHEYAGILSDATKKSITESSIVIGNDEPLYESVTRSHQVRYNNTQAYQALKKETTKLKNEHRKKHFSFTDNVDSKWVTSYQSGFKPYTEQEQRSSRGHLPAETKKDLRRCHFGVGTTEVNDKGNGRFNDAWNLKINDGWNIEREKERAMLIKKELKKPNYVIGDDVDYM